MSTHIVEMDDRGRILIPNKLRRTIGSRRFLLIVRDRRIELIPLDDPKEAFRKLKGSRQLPFDWKEAKRIAERLASEEVVD
ncbi:MAG: AbrB/MazE/SpoVT family DNA-binding domain-containing protein [Candidatus Korarchaeota archaeon]|nr:AbrB/MazE/SpoVT family DNA-binding domain-containing protein [Candidatus Korarchaeota archaeon]